jgi:hypothetical protein
MLLEQLLVDIFMSVTHMVTVMVNEYGEWIAIVFMGNLLFVILDSKTVFTESLMAEELRHYKVITAFNGVAYSDTAELSAATKSGQIYGSSPYDGSSGNVFVTSPSLSWNDITSDSTGQYFAAIADSYSIYLD